ncbi:hypothetical protein MA13_contig00005-0137 [Edwardsiella piscicida]|nr:hypothetical protein QY76_06810 [Edwardsiella sp. EA181011]RFT04290.1 hypothetical protein CGL57_06955 [Edwardsiella anguillarum]GAJ67357.1 hypothetical protein MA13_contig00005-0137 [Edwardsiella piscicida]
MMLPGEGGSNIVGEFGNTGEAQAVCCITSLIFSAISIHVRRASFAQISGAIRPGRENQARAV